MLWITENNNWMRFPVFCCRYRLTVVTSKIRIRLRLQPDIRCRVSESGIRLKINIRPSLQNTVALVTCSSNILFWIILSEDRTGNCRRTGRIQTTKGQETKWWISEYWYIRHAITSSRYLQCGVVDCARAFNHINHNIVIKKLKSLNVTDFIVCWVTSFLYKRQQCMKSPTFFRLDKILWRHATRLLAWTAYLYHSYWWPASECAYHIHPTFQETVCKLQNTVALVSCTNISMTPPEPKYYKRYCSRNAVCSRCTDGLVWDQPHERQL